MPTYAGISMGHVWKHIDSGILVEAAPGEGGVIVFDALTKQPGRGPIPLTQFLDEYTWWGTKAKLDRKLRRASA